MKKYIYFPMIFRLLSAQWFSMGLIGAISFYTNIIIARSLGPYQFGIYSTALSAGTLLAIIVGCGFSNLLQRERVRVSPSLENIAVRLPSLAYGHAILTIVTLSVIATLAPPQYRLIIFATIWYFGITALNQFGLSILRGDGRLIRDAAWQLGNRIFTAICITVAIFIGGSQPWQLLIAQLIGAAAFLILVTSYLKLRPSFKFTSNTYRAVLPFIWLEFATTLYFRADILIFNFLNLPKNDIGNYGAAYRIIEIIILFSSPISLIILRKFRKENTPPHQTIKNALPTILFSSLIGLTLSLTLFIHEKSIIQLIFGSSFTDKNNTLKILCLSLTFIVPNGVLNQIALALNMEKWCAISASISAAFNIIGNIYLIPKYGIIAAAWMTIATEIMVGFFVASGIAWKNKKSRKFRYIHK